MDFATMTDEEIRQYAAECLVRGSARGGDASYYAQSAALWAMNGAVGMLYNANYGAVGFDPRADIPEAAAARLRQANACFRWGY